MWQYELVRSAGSDGTPFHSDSKTSRLHMKYTFAEGVTMRLSLPWSSFEHMVGNWLVAVPAEDLKTTQIPIDQLLDRLVTPVPETSLPTETADRLTSVLAAGRLEHQRRLDAGEVTDEVLGVEESEEEGVDLTPITA